MCLQTAGFMTQSLGAGFAIGGAYGQATAHNMSVRFNANQLQYNAQIARMQAGEALEKGREALTEWRRGVREVIGAQKAAAAKAGVMVGTGSVGQLEASTRLKGAIGEDRLRISAYRESWYLKMMALQYQTQAQMLRTTKVSPFMAAFTAGLGAFPGLAQGYQGMQQELAYMNKGSGTASSGYSTIEPRYPSNPNWRTS